MKNFQGYAKVPAKITDSPSGSIEDLSCVLNRTSLKQKKMRIKNLIKLKHSDAEELEIQEKAELTKNYGRYKLPKPKDRISYVEKTDAHRKEFVKLLTHLKEAKRSWAPS